MSAPRLLVLAILLSHALAATAAAPVGSTAERANQPGTVGGPASILRARVLLDRARLGPGEIDERAGSHLRRALNGFQHAGGLAASGKLDAVNPELFWDGDPAHAKATIAAGPNNPGGRMWIDLSKPHYGFHGTPVPRTTGKPQSHGCVRLSNWDVLAVATAVDASVPVVMQG